MKKRIENMTNKEKAKVYEEVKIISLNKTDMTELIKDTHKVFFIYVNYCAKKYAKLKNKDEDYAIKIQTMYLKKYIFKYKLDLFDIKCYGSDLNYFRKNERLLKATEYYMTIQESYDIDEIKKNLNLIYDFYIEDLKNDESPNDSESKE